MPVSSREPGVRTGSIHLFATVAGQPGYSLCDGGMLSPAAEPRLFAVIGTTYGGDGVTTFAKPQICGEFVRGLDMGRGVDAGRAIGSYQVDVVAAHTHTMKRNGNSTQGDDQTGFASNGFDGNNNVPTSTATQSPAGAVETRPRNVAFPYCIKL